MPSDERATHRAAAENALTNAEQYKARADDPRGDYSVLFHQNLLTEALVHAVLSLGEEKPLDLPPGLADLPLSRRGRGGV